MIGAKKGTWGEFSKSIQIFRLTRTAWSFSASVRLTVDDGRAPSTIEGCALIVFPHLRNVSRQGTLLPPFPHRDCRHLEFETRACATGMARFAPTYLRAMDSFGARPIPGA